MSPVLKYNYKQAKKNTPENIKPLNYYKNDVFSLGLTFLNACTLESMTSYNSK